MLFSFLSFLHNGYATVSGFFWCLRLNCWIRRFCFLILLSYSRCVRLNAWFRRFCFLILLFYSRCRCIIFFFCSSIGLRCRYAFCFCWNYARRSAINRSEERRVGKEG